MYVRTKQGLYSQVNFIGGIKVIRRVEKRAKIRVAVRIVIRCKQRDKRRVVAEKLTKIGNSQVQSNLY
jgi:hypothetical protein